MRETVDQLAARLGNTALAADITDGLGTQNTGKAAPPAADASQQLPGEAAIDDFLRSATVEAPPPLNPRVVAASKRLSRSSTASRPTSVDMSVVEQPFTKRHASTASNASSVLRPPPPPDISLLPPEDIVSAALETSPPPPALVHSTPLTVALHTVDGARVSPSSVTGQTTVRDIIGQVCAEWNLAEQHGTAAWQLCTVDASGKYTPLAAEMPGDTIPLSAQGVCVIRRVVPRSFPVSVLLDDGNAADIVVNIFTTTAEATAQLARNDKVSLARPFSEYAILRLTVGGGSARFLRAAETPFNRHEPFVRYVFKTKEVAESDEDLTSIVAPVLVFDNTCARCIPVGKDVEVEALPDFVCASLNLPPTIAQELEVVVRGSDNYNATDGIISQAIADGATLELRRKDSAEITLTFLESGGGSGVQTHNGQILPYLVADISMSESISQQSERPSIDHYSSITSVSSVSDQSVDDPSRRNAIEMKIARNADKVAAMLGITNNNELHKIKSQITKLYGKDPTILTSLSEQLFLQSSQLEQNSSDDNDELKPNQDSKTKRISKLTAMLGIDNEHQLANFLNVAGISADSEEQRGGKSVQKVAKLLGVNEDMHRGVQNRSRLGGDIGTMAMMSRRAANRHIIPGLERPASPSHEPKPRRPKVTNGTFTVKIYMINQTFKSINVPVTTTAKQLIDLLVEKLNVHDDCMRYVVLEVFSGSERTMAPNERLYDAMCLWKGNEIFLFKKTTWQHQLSSVQRASVDSLISVKSGRSTDTAKRLRTTRRTAKVANIFGVNENKSAIKTDNSEISNIASMLSQERKEANVNEAQPHAIREVIIVKEGWLIKEEGAGSRVKGKSHWCWIENGKFRGRINDNSKTEFDLDLDSFTSVKTAHRKLAFEVAMKTDANAVLYFTAESSESVDSWLQAFKDHAKPAVAVKPAANETSKLSMDDFEIHRVLGRGKFGKVLLCSQIATGKVFAIKVIKKSTITDERQVMNTKTENDILRAIRHPFIVSLYYAFQTVERLYLVMEYVNGGEMFFHVSHFGRFSEPRVRFYCAEILLALQCLHGKGIVYRDLKLENILLDKDGHVKIADFGLSKQVVEEDDDDGDSIIAGTPEYLAPEVIQGLNHSYTADWWAFGNVMFELLCGYHPFYCEDRDKLFNRIVCEEVEYPEFVGVDAKDLLSKLFIRDPEKRIGTDGGQDIQMHRFFAAIDFNRLFEKAIEPPFKPDVTDDFDVSFFDDDFTQLPPVLTPASTVSYINLRNPATFDGFSYAHDSPIKRD